QKEGDGEKNIVYRKGAPRITATPANGITPNFDDEKPLGEWNSVEVVFWAGNCIHLLNGKVNLIAVNPRYKEDNQWLPLWHGPVVVCRTRVHQFRFARRMAAGRPRVRFRRLHPLS